jgi:hypothetical protein
LNFQISVIVVCFISHHSSLCFEKNHRIKRANNMTTVEEALAFAKDPATKKLGLLFNSKAVGNGEHVPKQGQ